MRKVILYVASSLDNFIASSDGSVDWLFHDSDYGYTEFINSIDTVLIGRKTYSQVLEFGEYPYKSKRSFVFTRQNITKDENVTFVNEKLSEFVRKLKAQNGKDIWLVGGGEIAKILLNENLVDEIFLSVHPIILGKGIPLFTEINKTLRLKLLKIETFESGLVQLVYKVL
ncbi:MAG: dihydrofolate reductase [Calditrichaeota bacterium]|nr:MAG: dihydrofolate reductase [Calditrichota bacterium]